MFSQWRKLGRLGLKLAIKVAELIAPEILRLRIPSCINAYARRHVFPCVGVTLSFDCRLGQKLGPLAPHGLLVVFLLEALAD